jgi:hypothetical protein
MPATTSDSRSNCHFRLRFGVERTSKNLFHGHATTIFIPKDTLDFDRDKLQKNSRYFARYFQVQHPQFNQDQLDIIDDGEDIVSFIMFHHFVRKDRLRKQTGEKYFWNSIEDLIDAYILSERIGATRFLDAIMDELLRKIKPHNPPGQGLVNAVWKISRRNSMLRKMFVEVCGSGNALCCHIDISDNYPNSFLCLVQTCYLMLGKEGARERLGIPRFGNLPTRHAELGSCWYHDHVSRGLECYREVVYPIEESDGMKRKNSSDEEDVDKGENERYLRKRLCVIDEGGGDVMKASCQHAADRPPLNTLYDAGNGYQTILPTRVRLPSSALRRSLCR